MFNHILVPLDGSDLSERALPMAQGLAKSSEATVHLIQMVSREHELAAGRGTESVQSAEYEMDMARRLRSYAGSGNKHTNPAEVNHSLFVGKGF